MPTPICRHSRDDDEIRKKYTSNTIALSCNTHKFFLIKNYTKITFPILWLEHIIDKEKKEDEKCTQCHGRIVVRGSRLSHAALGLGDALGEKELSQGDFPDPSRLLQHAPEEPVSIRIPLHRVKLLK